MEFSADSDGKVLNTADLYRVQNTKRDSHIHICTLQVLIMLCGIRVQYVCPSDSDYEVCGTYTLLTVITLYEIHLKSYSFFPFRSFSTGQIADFLGLINHVCAVLKVKTAIDLYLCYPLQKQNNSF